MASKADNASVIADLDKVVAPDIYVILEGKKRALPGDAPTEILLRVTLLNEDLEAATEAKDGDRMLELREEISGQIEELFALRDPQLPEGSLHLSDAQVGELTSKLFLHYYGGAVEDAQREAEEEGGARPTEPEAEEPPTPPTTPPSRSGSRSRARSGRKRRAPAASRS